MPQESNEHNKVQPPSILQVVGSVLASFFGVQSSKNKERDFKHGNHRTFIIIGIIMTAAFVGGLYLLVQLVMHISAK